MWTRNTNKETMIALVTPTGARRDQFALCTKWMQRQTYSGDVVWVIIDDAHPVTTDNVGEGFKDKWTIVKIYPTPLWSNWNTQARNIKAGMDFLYSTYKKEDISAVFIIEDDDFYRPNYLERMTTLQGKYDLWGEVNTIYYNVHFRRYAANNNFAHSSLFQTAFTYDMIPMLERCYSNKFIDCVLWTSTNNKLLFNDGTISIGMKGMPGRGGIGAGHSRAMSMIDDRNLNYLRTLIGDDAKEYERYFGDSSQPQHTFFAKRSV